MLTKASVAGGNPNRVFGACAADAIWACIVLKTKNRYRAKT